MAGAALNAFTDFFTDTTGPAVLTPEDDIINDAQLRNYTASDLLFKSRREVQGGNQIQDVILFDDPGTASTYKPGAARTIVNTQNLTTVSVPWRFISAYTTWTEAEILLNEGGGDMYKQYKNLKRSKIQATMTSLMNLLERKLLADPDSAAASAGMEATGGEEPYSMLATNTDDGLAPTGWTTVQGKNPTTETNWRNQTASYTASTPYDTDNGIIGGFDTMSQLTEFKAPPQKQEYFTTSQFTSMVILTNREGRANFMKAVRANNDITRIGPQDPAYPNPGFNGIPIQAVEALDDLSIFTSGSPHYLFYNMEYIKLIFHREKFLQIGEPLTPSDKPDTKVVWIDLYLNAFCRSRKRQGFLKAT